MPFKVPGTTFGKVSKTLFSSFFDASLYLPRISITLILPLSFTIKRTLTLP